MDSLKENVNFKILDYGSSSCFCKDMFNNYYHVISDCFDIYYQKHFMDGLDYVHIPKINYISKGTILRKNDYFDRGSIVRIYSTLKYRNIRLKQNKIMIDELLNLLDNSGSNFSIFIKDLKKSKYKKKYPELYKSLRILFNSYKKFFKIEENNNLTIKNNFININPRNISIDLCRTYRKNILEDYNGEFILNDLIY